MAAYNSSHGNPFWVVNVALVLSFHHMSAFSATAHTLPLGSGSNCRILVVATRGNVSERFPE
jgi:hypothetical protein